MDARGAFPEPDAALLAAADRWLNLIQPDRLRSLVESIPGPRSRLHAPEAMAAADDLITDHWRAAWPETSRGAST